MPEQNTTPTAADQERGRATSEWIESDDFTIPDHAQISERANAAAEGRALLEAALGGADALENAIRPGRPSLSGNGGTSPRRQVRFPPKLDEQLAHRAEAEHRSPSELIREAVSRYLQAP